MFQTKHSVAFEKTYLLGCQINYLKQYRLGDFTNYHLPNMTDLLSAPYTGYPILGFSQSLSWLFT